MSTVLDYPATELADTDYHAFNLAVWERLVGDAALAALDFRIETDRHGQMIMSPTPAPSHGNKQSRLARYLGNLIPSGEVVSECPVSTREGVMWVQGQLTDNSRLLHESVRLTGGFAFVVWFVGLRTIPASTAGAFTGMIPITAVLSAWLVLSEEIGWAHVIGIALVLAGILLVANSRGRELPVAS